MLVAQVAQYLENDHRRNDSPLENTKHNELQEILQRADILKYIQSLILRCYEHTARMNTGGKPEQIVTARMEKTNEEK
jgi:hypothetical protein